MITCTRSKMETVMGDDKKVKKLGMKDIQREGWEYELTVSLTIDRDTHMATASRDRTNIFEKQPPFIITEETGRKIKAWCELGEEQAPPAKPTITDKMLGQAIARINSGEQGLREKIQASYSLTESQQAVLDAANAAPADDLPR